MEEDSVKGYLNDIQTMKEKHLLKYYIYTPNLNTIIGTLDRKPIHYSII